MRLRKVLRAMLRAEFGVTHFLARGRMMRSLAARLMRLRIRYIVGVLGWMRLVARARYRGGRASGKQGHGEETRQRTVTLSHCTVPLRTNKIL